MQSSDTKSLQILDTFSENMFTKKDIRHASGDCLLNSAS